jgi:hypothetical protein
MMISRNILTSSFFICQTLRITSHLELSFLTITQIEYEHNKRPVSPMETGLRTRTTGFDLSCPWIGSCQHTLLSIETVLVPYRFSNCISGPFFQSFLILRDVFLSLCQKRTFSLREMTGLRVFRTTLWKAAMKRVWFQNFTSPVCKAEIENIDKSFATAFQKVAMKRYCFEKWVYLTCYRLISVSCSRYMYL